MACAWGARAGLLRAVRGHAGKFALCTTHAHDVLTAYIVVQHAVHHTALLLLALRLPRALRLPPRLRAGRCTWTSAARAASSAWITRRRTRRWAPLLASYRFLVPRGLHLEYVTTATSCFLPRPYDYLAPCR